MKLCNIGNGIVIVSCWPPYEFVELFLEEEDYKGFLEFPSFSTHSVNCFVVFFSHP